MSLIINNRRYSLKDGIGLLKTIKTENYDDLPEVLKHPEVKESWDKYRGVPIKLYHMCKSEDSETLEMAAKILEKDYSDISFDLHHYKYGVFAQRSPELYRISIFENY